FQRHVDTCFAVNDMIEFEAASFGTSIWTRAIVDDEIRPRHDADWVGDWIAKISIVGITAEDEASGVNKFSQFYQVLSGTVVTGVSFCFCVDEREVSFR